MTTPTRRRPLSLALFLSILCLCHPQVCSFAPPLTKRNLPSSTNFAEQRSDSDIQEGDTSPASAVRTDLNPLSRASWFAVEAFGKVFGSTLASERDKSQPSDRELVSIDLSQSPKSLLETFQRIQLDNERFYFLSGQVDMNIYDPDCLFVDPFVSFRGRKRFVENLANLGSFITDYSAKLLDYTELPDSNQVSTRLMVKLELKLPWKPVLAWPWGVTYVIDPDTFLVTCHEESWDIPPRDGVKQIFRKPTTKV